MRRLLLTGIEENRIENLLFIDISDNFVVVHFILYGIETKTGRKDEKLILFSFFVRAFFYTPGYPIICRYPR